MLFQGAPRARCKRRDYWPRRAHARQLSVLLPGSDISRLGPHAAVQSRHACETIARRTAAFSNRAAALRYASERPTPITGAGGRYPALAISQSTNPFRTAVSAKLDRAHTMTSSRSGAARVPLGEWQAKMSHENSPTSSNRRM